MRYVNGGGKGCLPGQVARTLMGHHVNGIIPPCMAELIDQGVVNLSGNPLRGQQVVEKIHEGRRGID